MLPPPLAPLAAHRRFVTYALIPDPDRPGKTIKRPTNPRTGIYCKVTDPEAWTDHATAAATGRPVGYVFNEADGFWFLDIDGALQPDGQWSPLAVDLCNRLAGAAVEVSQSGKGLHIIGRGAVPAHACRNIPLGLELYTHDRFCALTGTHVRGDAGADLTAAITEIAAEYFPPNIHGDIAGWTAEPVPEWGGPTDDAELLKAALASGKRSPGAAFNPDHVTFEDLWTADADKLAAKWPSDKGGYDASQADAALAAHLSFWTGKNCERVRELMLQSELARGKWEDRPEWLDTTIMRACSVAKNVAQGRPAPVPLATTHAAHAAALGIELRAASDPEVMLPADQLAYFAGCVYVVDQNKIWTPGTGAILDKPRFDAVFSGYVFLVDPQNSKPTDSPWDAFVKSRVYRAPRADRTCFRPEHEAGAIIRDQGLTLVNTYVPIQTLRADGDPTPFLRWLAKILPDPHDRDILLHFMASVLQNPGRKFQWCPVIQGAEGNGKSLLERIMAFSVGHRYAHLVNPEAMSKTGNQFNGWVMGNLWLGIEEIYVGPHRRDFLESFKTTVTNDRIALERKGTDQATGDNRINIMMLTNHQDAVPVSIDTRRYAVFFTAQQDAADIERDGMGGAYFPDLYDWFYGRGQYASLGADYGAAVINDYLRKYALRAELDPAQLAVRAPRTSSTALAVQASLGRAELEILEAVEEGRPGFAGGWISSLAVDRLLDQIRAAVPRQKRKVMLESLGFYRHPGLSDGRASNTLQPDNGKPRLYTRKGHLALNLTTVKAIEKAYSDAQTIGAAQEAFPKVAAE